MRAETETAVVLPPTKPRVRTYIIKPFPAIVQYLTKKKKNQLTQFLFKPERSGE